MQRLTIKRRDKWRIYNFLNIEYSVNNLSVIIKKTLHPNTTLEMIINLIKLNK